MKPISKTKATARRGRLALLLALCGLGLPGARAQTNQAWGTINNFDCVNTGPVECHGFEIELDDCHSTDITYTYDWNHYGTPKITEDTTTRPGHTDVLVLYEAVWTNTAWSAYTAVPTGPIAPTQGHQFTDPSTNFGGEHFGVGFSRQPTAVSYNWLVDDGTHQLILGAPVNVSTPTFTYSPPAGAGPAKLQAAIPAPIPPVFFEFGDATWVKEIRTTTHTNGDIQLRDLVSPDPDHPELKNWQNGEPAEVEVEWSILQIDSLAAKGGANGELAAAAENVGNGEDVVTRRWEFYDYAGPYDPENHEVMTDSVGPDGSHGTGTYSNTVVVGDFLGSQMSAANVASPLGLIDHLQDGEVNSPYTTRTVIIAADTNFTVTTSGALPDGMAFDSLTGQLAGTPLTDGVFLYTVSVSTGTNPPVTKTYPLLITAAGAVPPPHCSVDTAAWPTNGGTADGTGIYTNGTVATVVATPAVGYKLANWSEDGVVVSSDDHYEFTNAVNRSLVANFVFNPNPTIQVRSGPASTFLLSWPINYAGFELQESSNPGTTNWGRSPMAVTVAGGSYQASIVTSNSSRFYRLRHP